MPFATGDIDTAWNPAAPWTAVYALSFGNDAALYVGGKFRTMGSEPSLSLARIESDGASVVGSLVTVPGEVYALARQANGGMIVGGDFAWVNSQARGNLLRLQPDGSLDLSWAPSTDGVVSHLAIDSSDRVYAAGWFTSVGSHVPGLIAKDVGLAGAIDASARPFRAGVFGGIDPLQRAGLVRLAAGDSGDPDPTWDARLNSSVEALSIAADGAIYVGGYFTSVGGTPRNRIARLSPIDAAVDPSWDPDADGGVYSFAFASDGSIYAGGGFTNIGGRARERIAKLSQTSGAADPAWNPGVNGDVYTLLVGADGSLFAGGGFDTVGGLERLSGLAKLAGGDVGAVEVQWNPPLSGVVLDLAFDSKGALYAAGSLGEPGTPPPWGNLYKLNARGAGAIAEPWYFTSNGFIESLVIEQEKVWIGGYFSSVQDTPRAGIALLAFDTIFTDDFEVTSPRAGVP